jgi:hypothetical protein
MIYCKIIINRGVLIFTNYVVHLNHENENPTKYNFPIDCFLECLKPQIQAPRDQCILYKSRKLVSMNKNTFTVFIIISLKTNNGLEVRIMVLNATFHNISIISWRSVLLVEETGENHRPVASH